MEKNPQNIKNALCYIPFVAIFLYFTEEKKNPVFRRHIMYGIILLLLFAVLELIIANFLKGILALAYLGISAYLGYKAYIGEDVKVKEVDNFLEKKSSEKEKKKEEAEKKEEKSNENATEDVFEGLDK